VNGVVVAETIRRHLKNPAYWAGVVAIAVMAGLTGAYGGPSRLWESFVIVLAIAGAARLIGPEFSSGTLQLILSKPVNRSAYVLSRFAGVVAALLMATATCLGADFLGRELGEAGGAPDWKSMISSSANVGLFIVLVCALLALLGSFTRSFNNVALYVLMKIALVLIIGVLRMPIGGPTRLSLFMEAHPAIIKSIVAVDSNLYPSIPDNLQGAFTVLVLTNASVALFLACLLFRRREVPYGAD
jgi:ABC-type transport system involved in multi-copper enzyme maturation permease subunit